MAPRSDDINNAWAAVDTATTDLGTRVQTLIDEINRTAAEGLTGPQTEAVLTRLAGLRDNLNGMGRNANAPVPPAPVDVPLPGPFQPGMSATGTANPSGVSGGATTTDVNTGLTVDASGNPVTDTTSRPAVRRDARGNVIP